MTWTCAQCGHTNSGGEVCSCCSIITTVREQNPTYPRSYVEDDSSVGGRRYQPPQGCGDDSIPPPTLPRTVSSPLSKNGNRACRRMFLSFRMTLFTAGVAGAGMWIGYSIRNDLAHSSPVASVGASESAQPVAASSNHSHPLRPAESPRIPTEVEHYYNKLLATYLPERGKSRFSKASESLVSITGPRYFQFDGATISGLVSRALTRVDELNGIRGEYTGYCMAPRFRVRQELLHGVPGDSASAANKQPLGSLKPWGEWMDGSSHDPYTYSVFSITISQMSDGTLKERISEFTPYPFGSHLVPTALTEDDISKLLQ